MTLAAAQRQYPVERLRFTVEDYYRLAEAGILSPQDRVELIDGEVLRMSPMGSRHAGHVNRFLHLLSLQLGQKALVTAQVPLRLSELSEPEPDVLVLEPRADFYTSAHPVPGDVVVAIKISETSIEFDREVKAPLYAAAGVRELWIADLPAGCLHVYRHPREGAYTSLDSLVAGEAVSPGDHPDVVFPISRLIG